MTTVAILCAVKKYSPVSLSVLGVLLQIEGAFRMAFNVVTTVTRFTFVRWMLRVWTYATLRSASTHYDERVKLEDINSSVNGPRARVLSGLLLLALGCFLQCLGAILAAVL